ncbi:MAG TPA: 3-dehydroquinate synthase [Phycisphaerae bacterium]|nr:3-dehydroquinate synthase [Phycisphaerae bacterium]
MKTVTVTLPAATAAPYDIRVEAGALARLGEQVRAVAPAPSCAVVTDSIVAPLYLERAKASLAAAGYRVLTHTIPAGEQHKTLATASAALDTFLNARIERATPVIALGGGVVGDLAGLVAATLLRGVPFVQVPTTLLSAVDASVGGKVGVDHPAGKNLIGAFHQPRAVITDIDTFKSLPPRELRCGLAECVKHAIIRDAALFAFIETHVHQLLACDSPSIEELVARNVAIKAAIVMDDPFERGVRALLNLGHTFGHAIENVMGYTGIAHGEAVALGTVAATRLAIERGEFPARDLPRILALLQAIGLSTALPGLDPDRTFTAMGTDKKVAGGKLRLVLPTAIGAAHVVPTSDADVPAIRRAIASLANA